MRNLFLFIVLFYFSLSYSQTNKEVIVFEDGINALRHGPMSSNFGAQSEYHYFPEAAPKGAWAVSTFRWNLTDSWYVRTIEGEKAIYQRHTNKEAYWHPILIAGESLWRNYTVKASLYPSSLERQNGIIFHYRNDRCYYILCIEEKKNKNQTYSTCKIVPHLK